MKSELNQLCKTRSHFPFFWQGIEQLKNLILVNYRSTRNIFRKIRMVSFVYLFFADIQLPAVCARNIGLYRRHYIDII